MGRKQWVLTDEMLQLQGEAARRHGVQDAIHPDDHLFWFVIKKRSFLGKVWGLENAIRLYFDDGARSAEHFQAILTALGMMGRPIKVLEFASGYGCVTRHLVKKLGDQVDLTCSDIHPEAMEFLASRIGARSVPSAHVPEKFTTPERYDVVFALSFFSHMPRETFGRWLGALYSVLKSPGYLIFTTHGLGSHKHLGQPKLSLDGFWFRPMSEQEDLAKSEYGVTIAAPEFVIQKIYHHTGGRIAAYRYAFWWGRQDLWVVSKKD